MNVNVKPRHAIFCLTVVLTTLLSLYEAETIPSNDWKPKTRNGRKLHIFPSARASILGTVAGSFVNGPTLLSRSFSPVHGQRRPREFVEVDSDTGVAFVLEPATDRWTPIDPVSGIAIVPPPQMEFDSFEEEYFVFIPSTNQRVYVEPSSGRPLSVVNNINSTTGLRARGFNLNVGRLNVFNARDSHGVRVGNTFSCKRVGCMNPAKKRRLNTATDAVSLMNSVLELYDKLPKTGKPQPTEYSTLAGVVVTPVDSPPVVISLATGSKCLPFSRRSPCRLNDSHAEVIARRAAIDYALSEVHHVESTATENGLLFVRSGKQLVRTNAGIHLVITEPPCGDSMVMSASSDVPCDVRTGAKPILSNNVDVPTAKDVEVGRQKEGILRRKPGKGEATTSMSCSDKILRWSFLGFQGRRALSVLPQPLYFDTVVVSAPTSTSGMAVKSSMEKALVQRSMYLETRVSVPFKWNPPKICVTSPISDSDTFPFQESSTRKSRSNNCINWTKRIDTPQMQCKGLPAECRARVEQNGYLEVTIGTLGVKYGSPKSAKNGLEVSLSFQSRLCQNALMAKIKTEESNAEETYKEQWTLLREEPSIFAKWISSPRHAE